MQDIKDKVILITGASSGFGKVTAEKCVAKGAKVILGARRESNLKEICDILVSTDDQKISSISSLKSPMVLSIRLRSSSNMIVP